jgi:hypothetical protein
VQVASWRSASKTRRLCNDDHAATITPYAFDVAPASRAASSARFAAMLQIEQRIGARGDSWGGGLGFRTTYRPSSPSTLALVVAQIS